jgi:hypothetical protein
MSLLVLKGKSKTWGPAQAGGVGSLILPPAVTLLPLLITKALTV